MPAIAGMLLAVGFLLYLAGFLVVVALFRKELRQGAEVEAEVKALSLGLRFHVRPRPPGGDQRPVPQRDAKAARARRL